MTDTETPQPPVAKVVASLETINELLNTEAKRIAKECGYRTDNFIVLAHPEIQNGAMSMVVPGFTVQIHVKFPDVLSEFKTIVKGWLRFINRSNDIWTPLVLHNHYYIHADERKKWNKVVKRRLSGDPADEFPELIAQRRVKIVTTTTVTYVDMITKMEHSVTTKDTKPLRTRDIDGQWRELSRLVRERYGYDVDDDSESVGDVDDASEQTEVVESISSTRDSGTDDESLPQSA